MKSTSGFALSKEKQRRLWNDWPLTRVTRAARGGGGQGWGRDRKTRESSTIIRARMREAGPWAGSGSGGEKSGLWDSMGRSSQQNERVDIHLVVYTVLILQGRGDTSGNTLVLPIAYQLGIEKRYLWNQQKRVLIEQIRHKMCLGKNYIYFTQINSISISLVTTFD